MEKVVGAVLLAYLLGTINPAYLLGKMKGFDIRLRGTKNAGTMNVLRTLGIFPAILVCIIDAGKAGVAFVLAKEVFMLAELEVYLASVFVIIGHRFPVFLRFRGGKGVASGIGLAAAAFAARSSLQYWQLFIGFLGITYVVVKFILKR